MQKLRLFTLGTVQLGMPYGLAGARGGLAAEEAARILDRAAAAGIDHLDTARAYGDAEKRIGEWIARRGARFAVISKIRALDGAAGEEAAAAVDASLRETLTLLGLPRIEAVLTHNARDILDADVVNALRRAQERGTIGRFGASAYTHDEVADVVRIPGIGVLQVPFNVLSSEFAGSDILARAAGAGIRIFARSIFLQGALLMDADRLPDHLRDLGPVVTRLRALAREAGTTLPSLLIGAVKSAAGIWSPVLGVDSANQLDELAVAAEASALDAAVVKAAFDIGRDLPPSLTDPRCWPR